jgi:membrane associated rhomboid family serine protease
MFPLKDNVPTRSFPLVTLLLIAANAAVWIFYQLPEGVNASALELAYQPCEVNDSCPAGGARGEDWPVTSVTSMFMHGSWFHIIGNMLFLWIFGNNVEDSMGRIRFVIFYLLAGIAATAGQVVIGPSVAVPNIGASGAVAGVLGGYLLLFPRARVITVIFIVFFFTIVELPALLILGFWFLQQVLFGYLDWAAPAGGGGGVAYFAHIGGFVFGMAAIGLFAQRRKSVPPRRLVMR